ncbi:hypothetical protein GCM10025859_25090 [Alicyclobacillus fastidiosus]|nr:hypothetical protein GCM10025859_25090 [Alicyclobacillus fastidiosus]
MNAVGINERGIFIDKQSGKGDQYQLMKRCLRQGDIVYIHSLDRFGRNKEEILNEWKETVFFIRECSDRQMTTSVIAYIARS